MNCPWKKFTIHLFISITVDCVWSEFEDWGSCTTACGEGTQTRSRSKATLAQHDGTECVGESSEERACTDNPPCPSKKRRPIILYDK